MSAEFRKPSVSEIVDAYCAGRLAGYDYIIAPGLRVTTTIIVQVLLDRIAELERDGGCRI